MKRAVPQKYYEAFKIAYPEYKTLADEFYRGSVSNNLINYNYWPVIKLN
jgi:hypothetical protein